MRIRKGLRCCVPLAHGIVDRSFLLKGTAPGEDNNAQSHDDEKQRSGGVHHVVVEMGGGSGAVASIATTNEGHNCLDHASLSLSSGTMEHLEVDQEQWKRRLSTDGYS